MAKSKKPQRKSVSKHHENSLHKVSSLPMKVCGDVNCETRQVKGSTKGKEWESALCSVCMEYPHNAVLLLCSSYDTGCRPYMCATSCRFSNCLEQYKNSCTKVTDKQQGPESDDDVEFSGKLGWSDRKKEICELLCPLCRGQVKGWTVVKNARRYLNTKRRACMQENCSYVGTYKKLKRHVKSVHPSARPRAVDPSLAKKWKRIENETERNDIFSTIRSTMPGAIVVGDYVIERNETFDYFDSSSEEEEVAYMMRSLWMPSSSTRMFSGSSGVRPRRVAHSSSSRRRMHSTGGGRRLNQGAYTRPMSR